MDALPALSHRHIDGVLEDFFTAQDLFQRSLRIHVWLDLSLLNNVGLIYRGVVYGVILLELYGDVNVVGLLMLLFLLLTILLNVRRYLCLLGRGVNDGLNVYVLMRGRILIDVILFNFAGSERRRGSFDLLLRFQRLFLRSYLTGLLKGPLGNVRFGRYQVLQNHGIVRRCHFYPRIVLTDILRNSFLGQIFGIQMIFPQQLLSIVV